MRYLLAVALFLVSVSAQAQSLTVPTILYSSSMATDWTVTRRSCAIQPNICESNPLAKPFQQTMNPAKVAIGAAIDTAALVAWVKIVGPKHRTMAKVGLYVGTAVRIWAIHSQVKFYDAWKPQDGIVYSVHP